MFDDDKKETFDFEGSIEPTDVRGYEYKNIFSRSESVADMPKRMEERIKKVRKMRKNAIFAEPFKAQPPEND